MGSITRDRLQHPWVEEEEEVMESSAAMDALFRFNEAKRRERAREWMVVWAERGEVAKKRGYNPRPPPFEILDHPDLFERAWGWDNIYPWDTVHPLSLYKRYLQDYYNHNQRETNAGDFGLNGDDHVNGLAALAHSCTKMEDHLMFLWDRRARDFTTDDEMEIKVTSEKITKRAHEMINALESEFPAAAISFKCITKEAELMYECLISGTATVLDTSSIAISNEIRQCALSFMTYRKHEYVPAAAAMMGVMKVAKLMCELMRRKSDDDTNGKMMWSSMIRHRTLSVMLDICDNAVGVSTSGIAPASLNLNESDGMGFPQNVDKDESNGKNSKKQLARNNLEKKDGINENKDGIEKQDKHDGRNAIDNGTNVNIRKKLGDMLKTRQSPLGEKANKKVEGFENQNRKARCFSWPKPGGKINVETKVL